MLLIEFHYVFSFNFLLSKNWLSPPLNAILPYRSFYLSPYNDTFSHGQGRMFSRGQSKFFFSYFGSKIHSSRKPQPSLTVATIWSLTPSSSWGTLNVAPALKWQHGQKLDSLATYIHPNKDVWARDVQGQHYPHCFRICLYAQPAAEFVVPKESQFFSSSGRRRCSQTSSHTLTHLPNVYSSQTWKEFAIY